jgi:hypothetical protein
LEFHFYSGFTPNLRFSFISVSRETGFHFYSGFARNPFPFYFWLCANSAGSADERQGRAHGARETMARSARRRALAKAAGRMARGSRPGARSTRCRALEGCEAAGNSNDFLFTRGATKAIYTFMPATLTRNEMRLYQRARRARLRAVEEAGAVVIDAAMPRGALLKASEGEVASIRAKVAAIGSGAVITKTDGRLDVLRREAFETRPAAPPPSHAAPPPTRAPVSMVAIGGKPGRGLIPTGPGYPAAPDQFVASSYGKWQANMEGMVRALAARSDEQDRRDAALEMRLAAIEKKEAERVQFASVAIGILGWITGTTPRAVRS